MRLLASMVASGALFCASPSAQAPGADLRTRLTQDTAALAQASDHDPVAQRLLAEITDAQHQGGMEREAYEAARALGDWAFANSQWDIARPAWAAAAALTSAPLARGQALYAEGAAIVVHDTRGARPHLTDQDAETAMRAFDQAKMTLAQVAFSTQPSATLTPEQVAFAQAAAWDGIVRVKFADARRKLPPGYREDRLNFGPIDDNRPPCPVSLDHDPMPNYPSDALSEFGVAEVILWIDFDQGGLSSNIRVAAGVGGDAFIEAMRRVVGQWHATANLSANCQLLSPRLERIDFRQRYFEDQ